MPDGTNKAPAPSTPAGADPPARAPTTPAVRLPRTLALAAARRLVVGRGEQRERAARALVDHASAFGVDLGLAFGVVGLGADGAETVRQACLIVPGTGRTAMLFVSPPGTDPWLGTPEVQLGERTEAIRAAVGWAAAQPGTAGTGRFALVQALPEPGERWAVDAALAAGLKHIAELHYLALPLPSKLVGGRTEEPGWPAGVSVQARLDPRTDEEARADTLAALEASYEGTLDCPELFGLRRTEDVLDSHIAAGEPAWWALVRLHGRPEGVCLLNRCARSRSFELVYLGLSPSLRGAGVGRALLSWGLACLRVQGETEVRCAVDARNTPARRLYASMGFTAQGSRTALVRALGASGSA